MITNYMNIFVVVMVGSVAVVIASLAVVFIIFMIKYIIAHWKEIGK
jgi:hypothetical protein